MDENETTRYRHVEGTDHQGVLGDGSDAVLSTGVAGRGAWPGAPPEEPGALQEALPGLSRMATAGSRRLHRSRVNVAADVRAVAFTKADALSADFRPEWDRRIQGWTIRSASDPSTQYVVRVRRGSFPGYPWWSRLHCSCPNERTGRQVCWHKAAVVRLWQDTGVRQHPGEPKEAPFGGTGADTA